MDGSWMRPKLSACPVLCLFRYSSWAQDTVSWRYRFRDVRVDVLYVGVAANSTVTSNSGGARHGGGTPSLPLSPNMSPNLDRAPQSPQTDQHRNDSHILETPHRHLSSIPLRRDLRMASFEPKAWGQGRFIPLKVSA